LSSIGGTTNQIQNSQFLNTQPLQQANLQGQPQTNQNYQSNQQLPIGGKDEREWKGKMRKVSMGYMTPTDQQFQ